MITPGSYVTFIGTDGVERTEMVETVRYQSPTPALYLPLTLWQRAVRRLTPRRWLKPLKPVREAHPATVTLGIEKYEDVMARHDRFIQGLNKAYNVLTNTDAP